jgi:drug/metabolite transporter (DMT)-like permease
MTVNRSLPALTTSLGLLGVPVVGVLCSSVILDETLSVTLMTATVLIVGGIAAGYRAPRELKPSVS